MLQPILQISSGSQATPSTGNVYATPAAMIRRRSQAWNRSQKAAAVLTPLSISDAQRVRDFLAKANFETEHLHRCGYFMELPSARLRNHARLLDAVREPGVLNTLLRWFWLNVPQEPSVYAEWIPSWFLDLALSSDLLRKQENQLISDVMIFPTEKFLSVCDRASLIEALDPQFVLWPNATTRLLSRFTIRRQSRATLDLGTGNAVQALQASAHSDHVVATDLNNRAVSYAQFSARLNGLENIECLAGDGFAPVQDRKFDLIVSNPPFFITPSDRYLFCDNPMDLDQLCRRFVKEAPAYLNDDGYFQLMCEWATVRGQTWQERVSEWLEGTGCDAWVLMGQAQDPSDYAQHRISEVSTATEGDANLYSSYMAYYRERNVEAIQDGIIAMRKRSGKNWVLIEEVKEIPKPPFGDSVLAMFAARDFLTTHATEDQLLDVKPHISPNARLEQFFQPGQGRWQPTTLNLRLTQGFPFFLGLQPEVAGFLGACDGTRTLRQLVQEFAKHVEAPFEQVQTECLSIMRRLIERGFVQCQSS